MASIQKRPNGRWRARYRDHVGKEHARHFTRKVDAQRWLDEQTSAIVIGAHVAPAASRVTVNFLLDGWLSNPSWAESTRGRYRSIVANHIRPRWGSLRLDQVLREDIQAWVNELVASGLAGGTVRKVAGVLSSVLDVAVDNRRLAVNPAAKIHLPKQDLVERRYLSALEVERLADAADGWALIVYVLAYTGLRIGELAALTVGNVELAGNRRRFRIERSFTEVNGKGVVSTPKDHQRRSVPIPLFLVAALGEQIEGKASGDLVFPAAKGGYLRVRNMRRDWFDIAAVEAGLGGLTPHELRHTAASLAVSSGASVLALQRMLGHEKPSTTLDVYSDLFDSDLDDVAARLSEGRAKILADYLRTAPDSGNVISLQEASGGNEKTA